jgi:anti-sigma regulatory factor (Ser/Thr protein kinase)
MPDTRRQRLAPVPRSARDARVFVVGVCKEWGLSDVVETVELLTSELVTNGVLHARTELDVSLGLTEDTLIVSVHDHDIRLPLQRDQRDDLLADIDTVIERQADETIDDRHYLMEVGPAGSIGAGRGLLLVESLADEWGVEQEASGKRVWFRVAV